VQTGYVFSSLFAALTCPSRRTGAEWPQAGAALVRLGSLHEQSTSQLTVSFVFTLPCSMGNPSRSFRFELTGEQVATVVPPHGRAVRCLAHDVVPTTTRLQGTRHKLDARFRKFTKATIPRCPSFFAGTGTVSPNQVRHDGVAGGWRVCSARVPAPAIAVARTSAQTHLK
jgi:hypothetical protein